MICKYLDSKLHIKKYLSLYVKFSSDKEELSFFVNEIDMVDMDGIKYKSSEAIFEKINKVYKELK